MSDEIAESKTIKLRTPVTIVATTYTELALREPTVREVEIFQKETEKSGPIRGIMRLIQLIACVPIEAIEQMRMRDMTEASNYLLGFMSGAPQTGGAS